MLINSRSCHQEVDSDARSKAAYMNAKVPHTHGPPLFHAAASDSETWPITSRTPLTRWQAALAQDAGSTSSPSRPRCLVCQRDFCELVSHRRYVQHLTRRNLRLEHPSCRVHGIHNEKADPFANFPVQMSDQLQRLYRQFFTPWSSRFGGTERHLFPVTRYRAILESAPGDGAVLLGLLALVATQQCKMQGVKVSNLALKLQNQTIQAQRKACILDPCSDARIMTALLIMSNTLDTEENHDLSGHLKLISQFVTQRGGLQYVGMNGIVADNVRYSDHLDALTHNKCPKLFVTGSPILHTSAPTAPSCYKDLAVKGLITRDVADVATSLWILLGTLDRVSRFGGCSSSETTHFSYLGSYVEERLAVGNHVHHDTNTLNEAIIHACGVTNHVLLRNYGLPDPIVKLEESRLWRTLTALRTSGFFVRHNLRDLEAYLAAIGTLPMLRNSGEQEHDTSRFSTEVARASTYGIHTLGDLYSIMQKYGWIEAVCGPFYTQLWKKAITSGRSVLS